MTKTVIEVSDATFEKEVLNATDQLVVIEFSAVEKINTRGEENASAKMDAIINALAADEYVFSAKAKYVRVPVKFDAALQDSLNPATTKALAINHAPTLVFIRSRQELGLQSEERVRQLINEMRAALP